MDLPGTLETLISHLPQHAFLKDMKRDDATLYDAHPIHYNTRAAMLRLAIPILN